MMKTTIEKMIRDAIASLQKNEQWSVFDLPEISVERPKSLTHGDWTTNIAMVLAKELKRNPMEIAQELMEALDGKTSPVIAEISIAAPGYINFTLTASLYNDVIKKINQEKELYGRGVSFDGKTVCVEYTQPNPFKPFHIGHLMSNTIGESMSRLIQSQGATVVRVNYQGDVGPHVAKALWAVQRDAVSLDDAALIGKAYATGHAAYENDAQAKKEIDELNQAIYAGDDVSLMKTYQKGRETTLAAFEKIYTILGTTFDDYFFESEVWERGSAVVKENTGTIFDESDGAIIFSGEKYDLHTRVFITSNGLPTYEAKELGLALTKEEKIPADLYVITTAVEQEQYFRVVKKAIELVEPSLLGKIEHLPHGMMQLATGKMSSRSGNVVTGESLITDAQKLAGEKMSERVVADSSTETIDAIAVAGIKFSILKQSLGKNIAYDQDAALSFDGDSGPYIQYTFARCHSILSMAKEQDFSDDFLINETIGDLERLLERFPEVLAHAAAMRAPHFVAQYILELAQEFNTYYAKVRILDESDARPYRIALTRATAHILKNGLTVLGMKTPERM